VVRHQHSGNHTGSHPQYLITLVIVALGLYAGAQITITQGLVPQWIKAYGADLLALPVFLPLNLLLGRYLELVSSARSIRLSDVLVSSALFGVVFEGLLPLVDSRAVADPMDLLAYLTGGMLILILTRIESVFAGLVGWRLRDGTMFSDMGRRI
jgi:hypothetical protein